MPLSEETKKGLAECEYEVPTEIQKETLTLGLRGLDILGKIESCDVFTYFCKVANCCSRLIIFTNMGMYFNIHI